MSARAGQQSRQRPSDNEDDQDNECLRSAVRDSNDFRRASPPSRRSGEATVVLYCIVLWMSELH